MSIEFSADLHPSRELLQHAERSAPTDPFSAPAFAEAWQAMGHQPWILSLRRNAQVLCACPAYISNGRLNRTLEFMSLPALHDDEKFWVGVSRFSRERRVSHLKANSFTQSGGTIPGLIGETRRRIRFKYLIDLKQSDLWSQLSENHRRNVKLGRKAQLQVRRSREIDACREHSRLQQISKARRESRGERVTKDDGARKAIAFTQSGAGELFQAVQGKRVVSSILLLMASRGAYYESAGTTPEGMSCGAAHFLLYEIACMLKQQGLELLNLGGADPQMNPGLQRFKSGFGANKVEFESAEFFLGSSVRRKIGLAAGLLRSTRQLAKRASL